MNEQLPNENVSALEEKIKTQVKDMNTWLRLFFMVFFIVIFYFVYAITCIVGLLQFVARLITGTTFANLSDFNANLATYAKDLVAFITFSSDKKPFPFKSEE